MARKLSYKNLWNYPFDLIFLREFLSFFIGCPPTASRLWYLDYIDQLMQASSWIILKFVFIMMCDIAFIWWLWSTARARFLADRPSTVWFSGGDVVKFFAIAWYIVIWACWYHMWKKEHTMRETSIIGWIAIGIRGTDTIYYIIMVCIVYYWDAKQQPPSSESTHESSMRTTTTCVAESQHQLLDADIEEWSKDSFRALNSADDIV